MAENRKQEEQPANADFQLTLEPLPAEFRLDSCSADADGGFPGYKRILSDG